MQLDLNCNKIVYLEILQKAQDKLPSLSLVTQGLSRRQYGLFGSKTSFEKRGSNKGRKTLVRKSLLASPKAGGEGGDKSEA